MIFSTNKMLFLIMISLFTIKNYFKESFKKISLFLFLKEKNLAFIKETQGAP